ncbi:hypothetical protein AA0481_0861 [Acetobacter orientalis NRIC 0481]|uniref:Uncharacterized protein n=1 Tax=Acetobacter orientalis TaxID=146474 RepID=A0A0D6NL41_9PROT|nr:hypothetical protein Abor_019_019 [Acetobacter orientalis]GBR15468.1 hypothetical protein AA0481_0861 [Acetobacter orientalis NRIC 0481]GEL62565.1 hypothetical protein AOR02nite_24070 [Acetobacter orientalis]
MGTVRVHGVVLNYGPKLRLPGRGRLCSIDLYEREEAGAVPICQGKEVDSAQHGAFNGVY